ncbi:uncharacterized protein DFL_003743 [Arthrobotrys flagrans]|uniref:FAD/NAD(P)-binding domain-containing protein n=1 Tax=Arthrobotrys flagrans TaxID=97331 RepID=A0A437A2W1_ARTFL|nr:hypothetical protein DFL_003743 [Arthrobotrys flagrans]
MSPKHYKFIILGSGQSAPPLATSLTTNYGKGSTLIIEKSLIGGTCINYGCTPTKTMISSGRVAYLSSRGKDYGISTAVTEKGGISGLVDMEKVRQRKRDIVSSFRGGSERRLREAGVVVKYGVGRFIGPKGIAVKDRDGGQEEEYTADTIFINTGCRPAEPSLPGVQTVDKQRLLDSTSIMELDEVPKKLIVVGAGYVGLEFAQLFRRLGAEVTIVGRGKQVLAREDGDVAEEMGRILVQDGIELELGMDTVRLEGVDEDGMKVRLAYRPVGGGEEKSVSGSHVLWSAGRVPNTDMLDAEKGGPAFTHISYDDFRILKNNLISPTSPKLSTKDRMVPYTVYTDPQLGHIGFHEHEARKLFPNRNIKIAKMPMTWVARALETDETRGMMKAVVDGDTEEILGYTCLGIEGGEVMSMVQIAMMGGVGYGRMRDATFAHPTLAESLNNLWGNLE